MFKRFLLLKVKMFENDCFVSFIAVTCLKFMFIPLYKSTDFEVHRNWMAITYQKHLKEWYLDTTSPWTLDYPPLFAWFEFILSHLAKYFDKEMLEVTNLDYSSPQTVFFMRLSVILSDLVYFYGVNRIYALIKDKSPYSDDPWIKREVILAMLLFWNPGLLIVDHIHFQYNGFLYGILFISIADMYQEKFLYSAFWFTVLLNFKHIYIYLAPAYFIYFLKHYCFKGKIKYNTFNGLFENFTLSSLYRMTQLSLIVICVTLLSFGPFILMGQLPQVLLRLFPVKRGLTHAYWAPNVWALYNFADRALSLIAYYLKFKNDGKLNSCSTKGLVQECENIILPTISPPITMLLAFCAILPMFYIVWTQPKKPRVFINSLVLCAFGSFLFGYHVHEKAILMIILPLTINAIEFKEDAKIYTFLSLIGHFSLFPLLHHEAETMIKIFLFLLHSTYMFSSFSKLHDIKLSYFTSLEKFYLFGIIIVQFFYSIGATLLKIDEKLPFLPLMLISTYCAIGIVYSWLNYCYIKLEIVKFSNYKKKKLKRIY